MKACNIPDTCRRDQIEQYPDGPRRANEGVERSPS